MLGVRISRAQALSWRLERQFLVGGADSVEDVVRRLGAMGARVGDPDLAARRRLTHPAPREVAPALEAGRLMMTYRNYQLEPRHWPAVREIVRGLVADGPVTREQLAAGVSASAGFSHLGPAFAGRSDTFLKPFAWQGDLCFGPVVDGLATFQSPAASPFWGGIPDLDSAGPTAVASYFDAYGPATLEHLEALTRPPPTTAVTLLPGHDQWVLGPGTADEQIVPTHRRALVTRGANLVLAAGVVSGTWKADEDTLAISWFAEAGHPPQAAIDREADRLRTLLDRQLASTVDLI